MDIEQQLLVAHSRVNGMLVANYVSQNKKDLDTLIELVSKEVIFQQRASQALAYSVEHLKVRLSNNQLVKLIDLLEIETIHDAVVRCVLKILDIQNDLPKIKEGFLFEFCTSNILNPQKSIAIRAFSMPVAYRISLNYPELQNELKQILEGISSLESPGIIFRKTKYISLLSK